MSTSLVSRLGTSRGRMSTKAKPAAGGEVSASTGLDLVGAVVALANRQQRLQRSGVEPLQLGLHAQVAEAVLVALVQRVGHLKSLARGQLATAEITRKS